MTIDRQTLLEKLGKYLNQEFTEGELYSWALQTAVSDHYEDMTQNDPLIKETIQSILEMQHVNLKVIPTAKALEYYHSCLAGKLTFIPIKERKDFQKFHSPGSKNSCAPKRTISETLTLFARYYVCGFGAVILGIYAFSFLLPNLFHSIQKDSFKTSLLESALHIFYALVLLLPPKISSKGLLFYLTFSLLLLGMIYFWTVPFRLFHDVRLMGLALPLTAIPATLAVVLLVSQKERNK